MRPIFDSPAPAVCPQADTASVRHSSRVRCLQASLGSALEPHVSVRGAVAFSGASVARRSVCPPPCAVDGGEMPSGLLLTGPPGPARPRSRGCSRPKLAARSNPTTAAELTSEWVGECEDNVARLFAHARENAPTIIFIDDIDSIAGPRGSSGNPFANQMRNQLLAETTSEARSCREAVAGRTS